MNHYTKLLLKSFTKSAGFISAGKMILLQLLIILTASSVSLPQNYSPLGVTKKFDVTNGVKISGKILGKESSEKSKVSPIINYVISKTEAQKKKFNKINADEIIKSSSFVTIRKDESGGLLMPVFIKTTNTALSSSDISSYGGKVQTIAGDIIVAEIPVEYIYSLAGSSEISFIDASGIGKPLLNESRKEISADKVHLGTDLPQPFKGSGVIVGVVDSGIDWEHQDFQNSNGNRIQFLWDMSSTGNAPAGFSYGTEYTKVQLDAAFCEEIDGDDGGGHGTHVTGTAAGNGNANSGYIGMAPESDIIFVKGFRNGPGFADVDVVNGCNYIFTKADALGKPAVINLSLGGHVGAHDGTSLYEQALSNLTGNGKIIVAAAGNDGSRFMHVGYPVTGSSLNEVSQTYWSISEGAENSFVDMWYDSGNIAVGIAAYNKSLELIGYTEPVMGGQKIENLSFTVEGTTYGTVTIDATTTSDPNNGAKRVFLGIDKAGSQDLSAVYWVLYTYGTGSFDAWQVSGGFFTIDSNPESKIMPGDNIKTIGMPGTSKKLICVGSYVTKNQWVDIDGQTWMQGGNPTIGQISSFSSFGPSRDGRIKPDICAPGEVIVAALSNDLTISDNTTPRSYILQGGKLQKMQGTSMASPHVTGIVALMLQANSELNYENVISILKSTARKDNFTTQTANNSYGSGKLDAYNAVKFVSGGGTGGGQTTILQENFEAAFLPSNWSQQITNASNTWIQGNPQENNFSTIEPTSTSSAICPWVAENQDEWLITSPFALGNGNASLEFYAGYSTDWLSAATLNLKISTNGGANWSQLWTAENDGQGWKWRKKTIDLSSYAQKSNLKIGWQYIGNDGDLVGLDGIKLTGVSGTTDVYSDNVIPTDFNVLQNYPNPFNPSTIIEVHVPETEKVTLKVYDLLGSEVAVLMNEEKAAGIYKVDFNASNLASGIYYYSISAKNFFKTMKMMLLK